MRKYKIVVVEDEPDILEILDFNLQSAGYEVQTAGSGTVGLSLIRREMPDLVLLDLMLPGMNGTEICRALRRDDKTAAILIIMLTAKGEESDIVAGLKAGADDYITKPFSPRELLARIEAVLRRAERTDDSRRDQVIRHGELAIDTVRHKVELGDRAIPLTATEFRLLTYLAAHPGRVFTRDQMILNALGDGMVVDRNVDVHVRSIRKKLESDVDYIETIRGVGYRFRE